jgi:hypothetical protein
MSETNQEQSMPTSSRRGCICQNADESHLPFLSSPSRRPFPPPLRSTRSSSKFSRRRSDPWWDPHRFLPFLRGFPGSLFSPPGNSAADPLLLPRRLSLLVGASSEEGLGWCGEAGRRRDLAGEMAGGKELIDVKFRLFDGTDIGPSKYDPTTTVAALKQFVLSRWPQGETS